MNEPLAVVGVEPLKQDEIIKYRDQIRQAIDGKMDEFIPTQDSSGLHVANLQNPESKSGLKMSSTQEDYILATLDHESPKMFSMEMRSAGERATFIRNTQSSLGIMALQTVPKGQEYQYSPDFLLTITRESDKNTYNINFSNNGTYLTLSDNIQDLFPGSSQKEILEKALNEIKGCSIPAARDQKDILKDYMAKHTEKEILDNFLQATSVPSVIPNSKTSE